MKTWQKPESVWLIRWCVLAIMQAAWSASGAAPADLSAIQAIRQAPDPSAVVTAYGNGIALNRTDPGLYDAYVNRMVDLGLPELAFHQAQTLTTLQTSNGLAWGVIAYVDARRGQMPEAVSAINLAGQFAPENKFVAHTAGELAAWYDLKADKATLTDNAKNGLAGIRIVLGNQSAFTEAYATASKAYEAQTTQAPSAGGAEPAPQGGVQEDVIAPLGCAPPAFAPPTMTSTYDSGVYPPYADWAPDYAHSDEFGHPFRK